MQHEIFGAEWQHALIELMLQYKQYALKGQKLLAQGNRPGYLWMQACRPVRAKAFPQAKKTPL